MQSKHQVDTPMSGFWAVTRRIACLGLFLVAFAGSAYARGNDNGNGNAQGNGNGNAQGNDNGNDNGNGHRVAPEIATGAAITASLLAGGGLLLLADRLRGKKSSS
jgi:hypothetical protein